MGTGLARVAALLLVFAATIICIAPDYDLDPTVLSRHRQNDVSVATPFLLVIMFAVPDIRLILRTYTRGWLPSFATVLDFDCTTLLILRMVPALI
jgi:hypothetical protein